MTVFRLGTDVIFPDPAFAEPDGLLAVGGDLSPERLVSAYANGIFPWFGPDTPILWWSLNPRPVVIPSEVHVPRSLRRVLNCGRFRFSLDTAFEEVIAACAKTPRREDDGTWLTNDMIEAYLNLHDLGLCHSMEAWNDEGELVGGLYGVSLGTVFCGESMFYREPNASKAAFVTLCKALDRWKFDMVDCQQTTPHSMRFGAQELDREDFLGRLRCFVQRPTRRGKWKLPDDLSGFETEECLDEQ